MKKLMAILIIVNIYNAYAATLITTPTITSASISSITSTSATTGGTVTNDGGAAITAKGVCWSTTANPTIANSKTTDGTGIGTFTVTILRLTPGTTYHVRAYATNSVGTAYGSDITFTTLISTPTITTDNITSITGKSAISGGTVTKDGGVPVTARGVCWSTTANPTISDSKTTNGTGIGTFTSTILELTPGTTYHVRAYATNSVGTDYGNDITFTTLDLPQLRTADISSITSTSATTGGTITSDGGDIITVRGVCWSTTANPTISDSKTTIGTGLGTVTFTSTITGLTAGTTYHVRAYGTNSVGTAYGSDITFTTLISTPTITTANITSITSTSATTGGTVTRDGGTPVTARGICWSTTANPTIADSKTSDGAGIGDFTSTITGLNPGTIYHVRAYATNSVGTTYGSDFSFTTSAVAPIVETSSITSITGTSAISGGTITYDGGAAITAKGVCWSTIANPTISNSKTNQWGGTGTGIFTHTILGLTPGTVYHVRAYATNSVGTAYGSEITFTSSYIIPSVSTTSITSIMGTSAISGGTVTKDGGTPVIARGICWSTTTDPTIADSKTSDGAGIGSFTSAMSGLTPYTTFYVRAYATNSVGTAYGSNITFTTLQVPILSTRNITAITFTSAVSGGYASLGPSNVVAHGVCWSTSANPTISDSKTYEGGGTDIYVSQITGLTPGTTYHVRAYATSSSGTGYGNDITFTTIKMPILSTANISKIALTSATSGGTVTDDGGVTITAKGVCWSTTANPTIADSKTIDGPGIGTFSSAISGLTAGTTYHVRAYATNSGGTVYGSNITFTTLKTIELTTVNISSITSSGAISGGIIPNDGGVAITARGVCWQEWPTVNPTIYGSKTSDGTGSGTFKSTISGLKRGTTYNLRAYATNSIGTFYGNDITFTTLFEPPLVTTQISAPDIKSTNAWLGGSITDDGGTAIIQKGVCWSKTANPTINDSKTSLGPGFDGCGSIIKGLTPSTTYHVRAYATNSVGTAYGRDIAFTTLDLPQLTTANISSITSTSAISGGSIISDGGDAIFERGVCWSTTSNPTIIDNKTLDGTETGIFSSTILGLTAGTTYHVRAYATNFGGTTYGNDITFTTILYTPILTTSNISSITSTSAISGGTVTNDGGAAITARGVCWSTAANPTISNKTTTNGTGTGTFISTISGLTAGTIYHVRAYVTTNLGTGYGNDIAFTTLNISAIDETYSNSLKIYPNPTNGKILIKSESDFPLNSLVNLYSVIGEKIYSGVVEDKLLLFDLTGKGLRGLYLLQVLDKSGNLLIDKKIVFE